VAGEARIEQTEAGAVIASPGWFVVNFADVAWTRDARGGEWANPEPEAGEFEQYGIGIHMLHPGQPNGLYHSENVQEDFLVLSGECLLVIEEEERLLKAWDFVHCAPGTRHIFVGAGPPSENAARHGASVSEETDNAREAYRDWPRNFEQVRATWPL
jgi:quercetin dioxygenase-like cupin family protein